MLGKAYHSHRNVDPKNMKWLRRVCDHKTLSDEGHLIVISRVLGLGGVYPKIESSDRLKILSVAQLELFVHYVWRLTTCQLGR